MLFQTRQHWIKLVGPMGVGACLLLLCLIAGIQGESGIAWILFLIGAMVMGKSYLQWRATEYALTNKRIIVKSGILRRTSEEIMVDSREHCCKPGLVGTPVQLWKTGSSRHRKHL